MLPPDVADCYELSNQHAYATQAGYLQVIVAHDVRQINKEEGQHEESEAAGGNVVECGDGVELDAALLEQNLYQREPDSFSRD